MADSPAPVCPSCGARVDPGAAACDLCGTALSASAAADDTPAPKDVSGDNPSAEGTPAEDTPTPEVPAENAPAAGGAYCNTCGWQNPPGAKYCSQCGSKLQETAGPDVSSQEEASEQGAAPAPPGVRKATLPPTETPVDAPPGKAATGPETDGGASPPEPHAERRALSRQVAFTVGAAVVLVAGLFLVTSWSKSQDFGSQGAPPAAAAQGEGGATAADPAAVIENFDPEEPLPESIRARGQELQQEIEGLSGVRKRARQQELIDLYTGAGLNDRAAVLQYTLAEVAGTTDAWERAGSLLFDWWMDVDDARRSDVAQLTVNAYQRVLDEQPGNVDVRTNMAIAYLDTNNPMQGVQEIKRVLEEAPDHVQARLNYGIMLLQIGRTDQAVEQFERVQSIAGEGTPRYEQAERLVERVRQAQQQQQQDAPTGAAGVSGSASASTPPNDAS